MPNKKLEEHKFFPYVAWIVFISFALFVGNLAMELNKVSEQYTLITDDFETRLQALERAQTDAETEPDLEADVMVE